MDAILKQKRAYQQIHADAVKGMLCHAYAVIGGEAETEAFLTLAAQAMLCEQGGCGACRTCRRIKEGNHPDVLHFPRGEKMNVEEAEALLDAVLLSPVEASRKVVLLHHAHKMTPIVQNKLLKVLEEPPQNVHFVLGAANPDALLITVRSRVVSLPIGSFSEAEITRILSAEFPGAGINRAVKLSGGSLDTARFFMSEKGNALAEYCMRALRDCRGAMSFASYSTKGQAFKEYGALLFDTLSILLLYALKGESGFSSVRSSLGERGIVRLLDIAALCRKKLSYHCSFLFALDEFLLALSTAED